MLLSYEELRELTWNGTVLNAHDELINGSSIDVTLGRTLLVETLDPRYERYCNQIDLREIQRGGKAMGRAPMFSRMVTMDPEEGFILEPGQFLLAATEQVFSLPDTLSAEFKLKSSLARVGLQHLFAGWCDPGWRNSVLTLELKNVTRYHYIRIRPGDRIGQMVFFRHRAVPAGQSYSRRGRYNGDTDVSQAKADILTLREAGLKIGE